MNLPCANGKARKVLVVDDNPIIQRTTYFALRDQGYAVLLAGEIAEALQIVRHEHPDVVLLDLNFPPSASAGTNAMTNGFFALEWLQRMDGIGDIPVIIISSDDPEKSKAHALASGAVAYFQKPIDKPALVATVNSLLAQKTAKVAA